MWTCPNCGREFKKTNQDHYCGKAPASIDEYISRQEKELQPVLVCLKDTIHNAIPEAEETIAWGMPTWKKKGNIIHFAVSKNHIGIYVGQEAVAHFGERLNGFEIYKGAIRLKRNREIPCALISDIAKWSFTMDQKETQQSCN